jgi:hypothetical protein
MCSQLIGVKMFTFGATLATGVVAAVVVFSLVSSGVCLALAAYFAFDDREATDALQTAARQAGTKTSERLENPAQAQAAAIDFGGLAQLATALDKLNRSGRFLIASLSMAAVAGVAAGAGAIAGS